MDRAPAAMGRLHFLGCRASASRSRMSLKMYPVLLTRLKHTTAQRVWSTASGSRNLKLKNSAGKTKTCLVHCLGRRALTSATGRGISGAGDSGGRLLTVHGD